MPIEMLNIPFYITYIISAFIDVNEKMGLFEYIEFYQELEKEFGCHIDVVSSGIEDKVFLNLIEIDKKVLYAA